MPKAKIEIPSWDSEIFSLPIFQGIYTKYIPIINIIKNAPPKHVTISLRNEISILNSI